MKDFPTTFVDQTAALDATLLSEADADILHLLEEKGFEIHTGLSRAYANDISKMCLQPSIKEFCPNDSGRRFIDQASTEKWLSKGRLTFLLFKKDGTNLSLAGYGWSGGEVSSQVAGGEVTVAIRIGEANQGQGLSTPFLRLIIAATHILQAAGNFWLETWASDGAAVHVYHKIGCLDVNKADDKRPTASGGVVDDTRIFMTLPNELLK